MSGVTMGDEVFGTVDIRNLGGANTEFAVLANWAARPSAFPWERASAAGTSVETATRVLDFLDLHDGMTLLIDGAAGGVGSVAVQLAVTRGVRVIGTASTANHEFLASLGAEPTTYGPGPASRVGHIDRAPHVSGTGSPPLRAASAFPFRRSSRSPGRPKRTRSLQAVRARARSHWCRSIADLAAP